MTNAAVSIKGVERVQEFGQLIPCVLCNDPKTGHPLKRPEQVQPGDMLCRTHNLTHWPIRSRLNIFHSLVK